MEKIKNNLIPILVGILIIALVVTGILYYNQKRLAKEPNENQIDNSVSSENTNNLDTIDPDDSNDANNEVTVYVFHASYCQFCRNSLAFFNEIVNDYEYLTVETYQTDDKEHPDHITLYQAVGSYFNKDVRTIPYIIIGDIYNETGFGETTKDKIKTAIEKSHTSTKYHDVVSEVIKANQDLNTKVETIKKN